MHPSNSLNLSVLPSILIMPLSRAVFKGIARMATRAKWSLSPVMTASVIFINEGWKGVNLG